MQHSASTFMLARRRELRSAGNAAHAMPCNQKLWKVETLISVIAHRYENGWRLPVSWTATHQQAKLRARLSYMQRSSFIHRGKRYVHASHTHRHTYCTYVEALLCTYLPAASNLAISNAFSPAPRHDWYRPLGPSRIRRSLLFPSRAGPPSYKLRLRVRDWWLWWTIFIPGHHDRLVRPERHRCCNSADI